MKRIIILVCLLLFILSCEQPPEGVEYKKQARLNEQRIKYIKDERTDLCFAVITVFPISDSASMTGIGFTMIPCPRIEQFLEDPNEFKNLK